MAFLECQDLLYSQTASGQKSAQCSLFKRIHESQFLQVWFNQLDQLLDIFELDLRILLFHQLLIILQVLSFQQVKTIKEFQTTIHQSQVRTHFQFKLLQELNEIYSQTLDIDSSRNKQEALYHQYESITQSPQFECDKENHISNCFLYSRYRWFLLIDQWNEQIHLLLWDLNE